MIVVRHIEAEGLAQRVGFAAGDRILTVNGTAVRDPIDFQVYAADEALLFEIERDGQSYEVEVERAPGEPLGLEFEDIKLRSCNNKCVFCFIHQMPKGMRRSLYFEDDDYRLSFLHGSYVTLTNVKDKDIDRIIEQGLTPQYLSVHATDPDLRQKMLGRTKPTPDIMARIARLAAHGIEMHAQVVVCPGLNDGPHLRRTVADLAQHYPAVRSVALVPVGLTKFRQRLPDLKPVSRQDAAEYLAQAYQWGDEYQARLGERFVYLADELFLLNDRLPPDRDYYDAFPQVENGIGLVRTLLDDWHQGCDQLPKRVHPTRRIGLVTGRLASSFMTPIVEQLNAISGLEAQLLVVDNDFFGHGITVSGLLTGQDILKKLQGSSYDAVFLPPNCINGAGLTLDDLTVPQLAERAGMPLSVGQYDVVATLQAYFAQQGLQRTGQGRQLNELGYYVGRNNEGKST